MTNTAHLSLTFRLMSLSATGNASLTYRLSSPRDGAGRLYAYVHWLGTEMVRGYAGGYGYDKQTAAAANAAQKIIGNELKRANRTDYHDQLHIAAFLTAIEKDAGQHWDNALRAAGFDVWQVI